MKKQIGCVDVKGNFVDLSFIFTWHTWIVNIVKQ